MNKSEFIQDLKRRLRHLPKEDREDAIAYYTEYFEEMGADDNCDVTAQLGKPEEAAAQIITNCAEKYIHTQQENGGIRNSIAVLKVITLAVFASPFALTFASVGAVLLAAIYLLILCIDITGIALMFSSAILFVSTFFTIGIAQAFVCCGMGFIALGLSILILIAGLRIGESYTRAVAALFKNKFTGKKVAS